MSDLNRSIFNGDTETAKQLLDSGININEKGENNIYPISAAIASENPVVVAFVISNGADVNINLGNEATPLHEAIDNALDTMIQSNQEKPSLESLEIINLLIKNGADINATNLSGKKPLDSLNRYSATIERFDFLKGILKEIIPSIEGKTTFIEKEY